MTPPAIQKVLEKKIDFSSYNKNLQESAIANLTLHSLGLVPK